MAAFREKALFVKARRGGPTAKDLVIVAQGVTARQNDGAELVGLVEQTKDSKNACPTQVPADSLSSAGAPSPRTGS